MTAADLPKPRFLAESQICGMDDVKRDGRDGARRQEQEEKEEEEEERVASVRATRLMSIRLCDQTRVHPAPSASPYRGGLARHRA